MKVHTDNPPVIAAFVAEMTVSPALPPGVNPLEGGMMLAPLCSRDRTLTLCLWARAQHGQRESAIDEPATPRTWVMGSRCDFDSTSPLTALGNGVVVVYDPVSRSIAVQASIAGLPAVFVYEAADRVVVASDLWTLRSWIGEPFRFDPLGLQEFFSVGHPLGFRTLFDRVRVIPGTHRATLSADRGFSVTEGWSAPAQSTSGNDSLAHQTDAFLRALDRIQNDEIFLSLTAGIDSRTVLAGLLRRGRRLPVRTMSWKRSTLDARIASELCRHYGLTHETVAFDEHFARQLPELAREASRLSGGLGSVAEATEVAYYASHRNGWNARLSGHLGNQVGRGGVEAISARGCDLRLIADDFSPARFKARAPSFVQPKADSGADDFIQLLHAATYYSIGNFSIGHHFATQESPYASRELIEAKVAQPPVASKDGYSRRSVRMRDVKHRFAGEPAETSFQRMLICELGGFLAECPVNWGWRPRGGWSMPGLWNGALTFGDAAAESLGLHDGRFGNALALIGVTGRHNFKQLRRWCSREFLQDTLTQSRVRQGILSSSFVDATLNQYFKGDRTAFGNLLAAIDICYATELFTEHQPSVDRVLALGPSALRV